MKWWLLVAAVISCLIAIPVANAADFQSVAFKCSACRAIADSLAERLLNEKPRNHLDVRHRLDKHGNRYGRVIDFTGSELRAVEILENLCFALKRSYELVRPDATIGGAGMEYWVKKGAFKDKRSRGPVFKHQIDAEHKQLDNFCSGFLEEHEDEITAKIIRGGSLDMGSFSDLLCGEISKYCTERAGNDPWMLPEEDEEMNIDMMDIDMDNDDDDKEEEEAAVQDEL